VMLGQIEWTNNSISIKFIYTRWRKKSSAFFVFLFLTSKDGVCVYMDEKLDLRLFVCQIKNAIERSKGKSFLSFLLFDHQLAY
jgi:hypothetical protein